MSEKPYSFLYLAATLILLGLISFSIPARSARIDDLKDDIAARESEIQNIEAEIAEYQRQIDQKISEARTLAGEISRLDTIISKLNADIRLTQRKIDASRLKIEKLGIEIRDKNEAIGRRQDSLGEILRAIYEAESDSLVEIMLGREELSDFFVDLEYISNLEAAIKDDLGELKVLKLELEGQRVEEEAVKGELEGLADELQDRRSLESGARRNKSSLLSSTKNREAEYQKLVRERERQRAEILEEIRSIEDELRLLIDPSSLPQPRSGVLAWPVSSPRITQKFGQTAFATQTDVYGQNGHNGIDLRAPIGTPILAAEGGVIKGVGNSDSACPGGSYGRWVVVEHPNRLTTLYAHLSLVRVSQGQSVSRGELIGYSGDTGYTVGPHLHFTVYDARTVEFRQSRVCGILPYGGYLDPQIYL